MGERIERFEDLIAWQKARVLVSEIYQVTRNGQFADDHGLSRQIQRAAVSIMSNIAEGYERASKGDFHHFLLIAKGSCAEVRSQLYVALDVGYLKREDFDQLSALTQELGRVIGGLRMSVQRQLQQKRN